MQQASGEQTEQQVGGWSGCGRISELLSHLVFIVNFCHPSLNTGMLVIHYTFTVSTETILSRFPRTFSVTTVGQTSCNIHQQTPPPCAGVVSFSTVALAILLIYYDVFHNSFSQPKKI